MPQRVLDEKNQSNTTRSWRDLSKEEVRAIELINKGTRSEREKAESQALSTEKKKAADAVQNSNATAIIERLRREKANDDALYARTGINHGLRLPNPPTTTHGLQLVPLAPSIPLAPSQGTTQQLDTIDPARITGTIHGEKADSRCDPKRQWHCNNGIAAEITLNNFGDRELQAILVRYYHEMAEADRPTMIEVRNHSATLLGFRHLLFAFTSSYLQLQPHYYVETRLLKAGGLEAMESPQQRQQAPNSSKDSNNPL